MADVNELVKHIDEAYAMEQNVLRMLDGMIETTGDHEIRQVRAPHGRNQERTGRQRIRCYPWDRRAAASPRRDV